MNTKYLLMFDKCFGTKNDFSATYFVISMFMIILMKAFITASKYEGISQESKLILLGFSCLFIIIFWIIFVERINNLFGSLIILFFAISIILVNQILFYTIYFLLIAWLVIDLLYGKKIEAIIDREKVLCELKTWRHQNVQTKSNHKNLLAVREYKPKKK